MQLICNWLANRGGVAVWQNKELGSSLLGQMVFTPAFSEDLKTETMSPGWRYGNGKPERIIKSLSEISIPVEIVLETATVKRDLSGKMYKASENMLEKRINHWKVERPELSDIWTREKEGTYGEQMEICAESGLINGEDFLTTS